MSAVRVDSAATGNATVVAGARERLSAKAPAAQAPGESKLRKVAGQLVAQAFFAPMLAQMRNSPFKDEKFSGGRGGEAFDQMMDQQLVKQLTGPHDRLTNTITKHFAERAEAAERSWDARKAAAEGKLARAGAGVPRPGLQGESKEGRHVDIAG